VIAGSAAAIAVDDLSNAFDFCEKGLRFHPHNNVLRNNKAFILIENGTLAQAHKLLMATLASADGNEYASATATFGFYCLRSGNFNEGRRLYQEAISWLRAAGNAAGEAVARAYFALEAARSELAEAPRLISEAKEALKIA
jgi:Tfp pilus assembly protein PilF